MKTSHGFLPISADLEPSYLQLTVAGDVPVILAASQTVENTTNYSCLCDHRAFLWTDWERGSFFCFLSSFFLTVQSSERLTVREITETLQQNLSARLIDCLILRRASEAAAAPPTDRMVEGGGEKKWVYDSSDDLICVSHGVHVRASVELRVRERNVHVFLSTCMRGMKLLKL